MGRKVFVSYKYYDAHDTRDELIRKLGKDGHYYHGEKGYNPLNVADNTLKNYLKEMIFGTSVTVVIISPNVRNSDWVDWEIRYSLRQPSHDGTTSFRNGIVCVVQNCRDYYGNENTKWAQDYNGNYRKEIFPQAIIDNMKATFRSDYNRYLDILNGRSCNSNNKDYCVVIGESSFKLNPSYYIEEAYNRAHDNSYRVTVNEVR